MNCPIKIHSVLSKILATGLLQIRAGSESVVRVDDGVDHLHNLPNLLDDYEPYKLVYYWQVERPEFLRSLTDDERLAFEPLWAELADYVPSASESAVQVG